MARRVALADAEQQREGSSFALQLQRFVDGKRGERMAETNRKRELAGLTVGAVGVVYGDIGTSPLYALRACFLETESLSPDPATIFGILSLIIWSLILVVSIKYLVFILRADNGGEGGILALLTLLGPTASGGKRSRRILVLLGIFGAALLYGDGMITPAISVLSAAEGLTLVSPDFESWILVITGGILLGLFMLQRQGTSQVGKLFGPIMCLWFVILGGLGIVAIVEEPSVLQAFSPVYALRFVATHGATAVVVLGAVFLVVTGSEALYADMGHFGRRPMRVAWFSLVLPALLLNYLGQGALLMRHPEAISHPFYQMVPTSWVLPLVLLSTVATCIASQALISGAFSLTRQAVSLGVAPRLTIRHTSAKQVGQIYVPFVNWVLCFASILLVVGFEESTRLAAAYGIAVAITMVITSTLFIVFLHENWRQPGWVSVGYGAVFLSVDLAFVGANLSKLREGGWVPISIAAVLFFAMTTWHKGRQILASGLKKKSVSIEKWVMQLDQAPVVKVPGTALFCTRDPDHAPIALIQNLTYNHVLHEKVGILTVFIEPVPRVSPQKRVVFEWLHGGVFGLFLHFGFMEAPHIPRALRDAHAAGLLPVSPEGVIYFLGGEQLRASPTPSMALWRERLFVWLSRNAQRANVFFHLPSEQVVEIGTQIEI